jgi:hypothetical protein
VQMLLILIICLFDCWSSISLYCLDDFMLWFHFDEISILFISYIIWLLITVFIIIS